MAKRLEILLNDTEYAAICEAAERRQTSVSEWVRQALRDARQVELTGPEPKRDAQRNAPDRIARKLQALERAAQYNFPTADIDQMLQEIKDGYMMR
jgi:Arc/MetJ-type ribon-helix-helix transcriptional regulator